MATNYSQLFYQNCIHSQLFYKKVATFINYYYQLFYQNCIHYYYQLFLIKYE
jgi:hypothetical protein